MRKVTPPGAQRPWRSARNVAAFQRALAEGADPGELVELLEGAAELVACGRQQAKWWYPENLLGERTLDRWLGDIAELRADQERAAARETELAQVEARSLAERDASAELTLPHMGLRRVVAEAEAAIAARRGGTLEACPTRSSNTGSS